MCPERSLAEALRETEGLRSRSAIAVQEAAALRKKCQTTLPDGRLIAYVYNINDERHLDYATSADGGCTWSTVQKAFMAKKIRNPQMAAFKDGFVLHGRSGNKGEGRNHFVLYTSHDGVHWDAGRYLRMGEAGAGAYSNNLIVHNPHPGAPERLLIQASHAYEEHMTNVLHWWLR